MASDHAAFLWDDPFLLDEQLSDDERMIRQTAAAYAQDQLMPRVLSANREERFDRPRNGCRQGM